MAYSRNALQRVGPQNSAAPSLWTYSDTGSTLAQIDGSGYFNNAADILQVGDFIHVVASNGYGIGVVATNTRDLSASPPVRGVVDVTNMTAVGTINSD